MSDEYECFIETFSALERCMSDSILATIELRLNLMRHDAEIEKILNGESCGGIAQNEAN
jgi:hypothetical protein